MHAPIRMSGVSCLLIRVALLSVAFAFRDTHAQGTSGALPDPITTDELAAYSSRLSLSDDQRVALQLHHDQYVEWFRTLREGPIKEFLGDNDSSRFGVSVLPDPRATESQVRTFMRLEDRIGALDARLFGEMRSILTEDQLPLLRRVRQSRQRARARNGMAQLVRSMNPAAYVDLGAVLKDVGGSPNASAQIDAVMARYEETLTSGLLKLHELGTEAPLEFTRKLRETGAEDDAERRIWEEISRAVSDEAAAVSDLNRRTLRVLDTLLPAETARRLRLGYYDRAYPESSASSCQTEEQFSSALSRPDITGEERDDILAARATCRNQANRITLEMIDLIEENRRGRSLIGREQDHRGEYRRQLDALREQRDVVNMTAIAALKSLFAVDDTIGMTQDEDAEDGRAQRADGHRRSGRARDLDDGRAARAAHVVEPITARQIRQYAGRIDLGDDGMVVVDTLHEQYLEQFAGLDCAEDLACGRASGLDALTALDNMFFTNLEAAIGRPEFEEVTRRLRLARERQVYVAIRLSTNWVVRRGRGGAPASDPSVDLTDLVYSLDLSDDESRAVEPELRAHERRVTPSLRLSCEASMDYLRTLAELRSRPRPDGDEQRIRRAEEEREAIRARRNVIEATDARVIFINRETLAKVADVLSDASMAKLLHACARQTFPTVYDDPRSAGPKIAAALSLEGLTPAQRASLGEIAAEYHAAYDDYCARMIRVKTKASGPEPDARTRRQGRRERRQALEKLTFERDELSSRTIARLRALLTEGQAARLGGLRSAKAGDA